MGVDMINSNFVFALGRPRQKSSKYQINSEHKWRLQGVTCEVCGETWGNTGSEYPLVSLDGLAPGILTSDGPTNIDEFLSLRAQISVMVPAGYRILPGTEFGPSQGTAQGTFSDFVWNTGSPTVFLRRKIYEILLGRNILMPPFAEVKIDFRGRQPDLDYVELQLIPSPGLTVVYDKPIAPACRICGRENTVWPTWPDGELTVLESSIPKDFDLFRMFDLTTCILGTDRFKQAVEGLKLSGLEFEPILVRG